MPFIFVYTSMKDAGLTSKQLGHVPSVLSKSARLDKYRVESPGTEYQTLVEDPASVVIGQIVVVRDNDLITLDTFLESHERINVQVDGIDCIAYVMRDIYRKEEQEEVEEFADEVERREFLKKAIERFDDITRNTEIIRQEFVEDTKFKFGAHWQESIAQERQRDKRPMITINRCANFIDTVVNQSLQNPPGGKVRPNDDATDPATAEVVAGLIRGVLKNEDSKTALGQAYDDCVTGGIGYFRVEADFEDDNSFDQVLKVTRIQNPMSVYYPIHLLKTLDFSDARYCFVREKISVDEFDERWPDKADARKSFTKAGTGDRNWLDEHHLYIAEYFTIDMVKKIIYLLPDGKIANEIPDGITPVRQREVMTPKVNWYLITSFDILESGVFPGKRIPIIPIIGKEIIIDNKKHLISLTRNLREPQKMFNFMITAMVETIDKAPKSPYIVEEQQIKDYKEFWENANKQQAYLPYKATDIKGNAVPPPQRQMPPELGQGLTTAITFFAEFMKDVSGIHDASLGATSNERTGKAIQARTAQGALATYHYINGFNRAVRELYRLLIDIIPVYYDTPRAIRIVGEDMVDKVVLINQMHSDPANPTRLYDLTVGKYSVVVTNDASYDTRRLETQDMLSGLMQTAPNLTMIFFDILARVMDMPGGQEIAARAKRFIQQQYPGVIADEEMNTPEEQLVQQVQAMTQDMQKLMAKSQMDDEQKGQMGEMIGTLQKALKDKQDQIQATLVGKQIDATTKLHESENRVKIAAMSHHNENLRHVVDTAVSLMPQSKPSGGYAE